MTKKQRLWDKGEGLNQRIHRFTVGDDPQVDLNLVDSDIYGSAAHAKMLRKVGILSEDDLSSLLDALKELLAIYERGQFQIPDELEDCHTTIETFLVERCGEAGRRIHTGRSRNDQVLLVVRLFMRKKGLEVLNQLLSTAKVFFARAKETFDEPMPGYSHFQPAMPTTVGIWFHAFGEAALDCIDTGIHLLQLLDRSPLGVGSGFGTTFPLDREMVAQSLGLGGVQRNAIDVQNSRGRYERRFAAWMTDIAAFIEKIAVDLVLFTTREYGFFHIPSDFTTGSSIMPQKHNPDVLELLRARAAKLRAAETEISLITAKLPSHYHRDFQLTKEPLVRSVKNIQEMLPTLDEVVKGLTLNSDRLRLAMTDDLFATYDAFREVKAGLPFRDAYRKTAERASAGVIRGAEFADDFRFVIEQARKELADGETALKKFAAEIDSRQGTVTRTMKALLA